MKGIISSLIVIVAFLGALAVAISFAANIQQNYDIVNGDAIGDRVFYKFSAIEKSISRIMEQDLNATSFSVGVSEGRSNKVTFNVTLPSVGGNFSTDLADYERFAESQLNETNLAVDLNLTQMRSCMPLTVTPYNISFGTFNDSFRGCGFGSGQRNVKISMNGSALGYLKGYDMSVRANRTRINAASATWLPAGDCTGGTINWTIKVAGNMSTVYGPVTNMVQPGGKCVFSIYEQGTNKLVMQVNNSPFVSDPSGTLSVGSQPGFNVSFVVTLNLTDAPGKLKVLLPPQLIRVRETLFHIEKNDTATIQ